MTEIYSHHALSHGTMIQEYRIDRVLGVGSFGIVYTAVDTYFCETVAIKEFFPTDFACRQDETQVVPISSKSEEDYRWSLEKFLDEARTLRQLTRPHPHRNIVRVRQFLEANGTAYIVMDHEEGRSLLQILEESGSLPKHELRGILRPLLDGLERVHAASLLHRGIKPSNILIRHDQSPVLIDFGTAHRKIEESDRTEMMLFSHAYAAPEQVHSAFGKQGPWTDIYALGATLYHAVTGEKPTNATERLLGGEHVSATQAAAGNYPINFLVAIDAAIELKPENRPQSILEWRREWQCEMVADDDATVIKTTTKKSTSPVMDSCSNIETWSQTIQRDVWLGASSPASIAPKSKFVVRFAAYTLQTREQVSKLFEVESPGSKQFLDLHACQWEPGTKVAVHLSADELVVGSSIQSFVWNGAWAVLRFDLSAPESLSVKHVILRFDIFIEGLIIARLRPELKVIAENSYSETTKIVTESKVPKRAFASYSSRDLKKVLGRIRSLQIFTGIDVFMDCLSIKPSEKWKKKIRSEIFNREIFWLFWSKNAKTSSWVEWEWRTALNEKTIQGIQPHPLEPPSIAPPPDELAELQFGGLYEAYLSQSKSNWLARCVLRTRKFIRFQKESNVWRLVYILLGLLVLSVLILYAYSWNNLVKLLE